jgi:hypothetical protein
VVSNLSYMNLVMMLVFPTDWSPRNTSLYLANADTTAIARAPATAPALDRSTREIEGREPEIPRCSLVRGGGGSRGHHDARTSVLPGTWLAREGRGGGVSSGCGRAGWISAQGWVGLDQTVSARPSYIQYFVLSPCHFFSQE